MLNLQKMTEGQTLDLTKGNAGLKKVTLGLSWGGKAKGGLLSALFSSGSSSVDVDSSILAVDENGRKVELVYFGNKTGRGIKHHGDDLTGRDKKGTYDNEEIDIVLDSVPNVVTRLYLIANVYSSSADFAKVENCYTRVLDGDKREELARFELSKDYRGKGSVVIGELYRYKGEWKFRALGKGVASNRLGDVVSEIKNWGNN